MTEQEKRENNKSVPFVKAWNERFQTNDLSKNQFV